jgi:BirA family biotin operon repressor/biotin-[acetyl-CoA-carboxylase] ligase
VKFIFKDSLDSTNNLAHKLLEIGKLIEPTVIFCHFQTAGKGYANNFWESENGKNLTFSMVVFPRFLESSRVFFISIAVSLALADFLEQYVDNVKIKWPNDIYVGNYKIAGILIENSVLGNFLEHSIVGIGLNVNQIKFKSPAPNPISLSQLTHKNYNLNELLHVLVEKIQQKIIELKTQNFELLLHEYCSKLFRYNEFCKYKSNESIFDAKIINVTEYGFLQLQKKSGEIVKFTFKEVEFIN